jgi:hemin uptake protein HemP
MTESIDPDDRPDAADGDDAKVVRAEELFGERREIWIELDGVRYRLRITRRGKLILQK